MKKATQKIMSLLLAGLLLLSTVSFTVEKHYCGRILVDVALFSETKGCGMEMENPSSCSDFDFEIKKKSCCTDEITIIEGQDELKVSFNQMDFPDQVFFTSFFFSDIHFLPESQDRNSSFKEYSPPDLVRDVITLHETFLI